MGSLRSVSFSSEPSHFQYFQQLHKRHHSWAVQYQEWQQLFIVVSPSVFGRSTSKYSPSEVTTEALINGNFYNITDIQNNLLVKYQVY